MLLTGPWVSHACMVTERAAGAEQARNPVPETIRLHACIPVPRSARTGWGLGMASNPCPELFRSYAGTCAIVCA